MSEINFKQLAHDYPHAVDAQGVFHIDWMDDPERQSRENKKDRKDAARAQYLNGIGFSD